MPDDSYPTVSRSFAPEEFRPYDPMTPYVERGVDLLKRGVTNASEWASSMVDEFGERILPYVDNIRGQAQAIASAFTPGAPFNPAPFANETSPVSSKSLMVSSPAASAAPAAVASQSFPKGSPMYDEDLAGYGSPRTVAAPLPATFGYMYGSSRYANEPPVPRPTQAQLEALPANTLTDIPTGGWAYRETVPHQERLMQLDREAQKAQQAAQAAAQDAQMFAQMSRVARSMKDIEVARREVNFGIAQRRIANGEAPHQVFASMPGLFGSGAGYAAAVNATKPVTPPRWVPPTNGAPGYFQTDKGITVPPASAMQSTPLDASLTVAKDPETGKRIGLWGQTSHGARRLILDETPKGLTPGNYIQIYNGQERGINAELATIPALAALKNLNDPQHDYYMGLQQKLKEVRANRDALATIGIPAKTIAPPASATNGVSRGVTGRINSLPPSKSELVTGQFYDTKRGVARWNGTKFELVETK